MNERARQASRLPTQPAEGSKPFGSPSLRFKRLGVILAVLSVVTLGGLLSSCSTLGTAQKSPAKSFEQHRAESLAWLREARDLSPADTNREVTWNAPTEWLPTNGQSHPRKGILLVHGLGDSPWTFHDVAEQLAAQGFLVRTVLLTGHGTRPEDLLSVTAEQWQALVGAQADALRVQVDELYLGGFSTGANLVLERAYSDPTVAGLLLFSPGFKSMPFDWLAPLAARVRPWMVTPRGDHPMHNEVRYFNVPTNGFAQFYRTSARARHLLRSERYDKPVFMVVASHDSVLDSEYLLETFQRRFTHPRSRLIWYGDLPRKLEYQGRVLARSDRLPAFHISQFSHMGIMFSPENELYGEHGSLRICLNGQSQAASRACEAGDSVWYSDWGYREEGKIHARLTFNPYFAWQGDVMAEVFNSN